MEAFDRTLKLLSRIPNAILVINLTLIAVMGDLVLTHIWQGLPYFNLNVLFWRVAPLSDHVAVYIGMGVFFLIRLYQRGYGKVNWFSSYAPIYAFGEVMLVFGLCQVEWGYIVAAHDPMHLANNAYMATVQNVPWFALFFAGGQYFMFLGLGLYTVATKRMLAGTVIFSLPLYIVWAYIGSPMSLSVSRVGQTIQTPFYNSIGVNGLELFLWLWVMALIVLFNEKRLYGVNGALRSSKSLGSN